jgi:hypothetical protein
MFDGRRLLRALGSDARRCCRNGHRFVDSPYFQSKVVNVKLSDGQHEPVQN